MMNIIKTRSLAIIALISLFAWSCKKNEDLNFLTEQKITDFDLVQLTNSSPNIPVNFEYGDGGVPDSVGVYIYRQGSTTLVAKNLIKSLTKTSISGATVSTPFPLPSVAPSGIYTLEIILYGAGGQQSKRTLTLNIINATTPQPPSCAFPDLPLPAGRNVWIRITAPENTGNDDIFITGNFETAMGGGDWSGGGNTTFRMTRLSAGSRCYYIAVNLPSGGEFKFTRGDWNKRVQDGNGADVPNFVYNGQSIQSVTVENWSDRVVIAPRPEVIPSGAISTNRMTVVFETDNAGSSKYYVMKRGGNFATDKIEMTVFGSNPNKFAASVPRELNTRYLIYRDDALNNVINAYGIDQAAIWDGATNPVMVYGDRYKPSGAIRAISTTLALVGGATPVGWNNNTTNPQIFTVVPSTQNYRFEYTVSALTNGNGGYLLIPTPGDWNQKWGARGSFLNGNVIWGGSDFIAPSNAAQAGKYKIEVDFERGMYKLSRQP